MQPRGKVKVLIDAMQAQPEKALWSAAECGAIVGKNVSSQLSPAVRRGWLHKHDMGSRRTAYSLQPQQAPEEPPAEPVPFAAGLWDDGDLVLYGIQQNEDGSVTLTGEQVQRVRRLLEG